ncbi:MAG: WbqC family protein [Betaproteobacteria bacterium]|nr:WbqC family protein [Betaproteobacteria bacterium]
MKKVAIVQSNYIPWKGYFDIVGNVDLFVFHDDLQYTKGDWRNRNKIKTPKGAEWITVPCGTSEHRLICDVELTSADWQRKHWNLIQTYYAKAPYFKQYSPFFEEIYLGQVWKNLSDLNQHVIRTISTELLGMTTRFDDSRTYHLKETKANRVIELLKKVGAKIYLSGPAAKSYLTDSDFSCVGISLEWMDYDGYPEYLQLYPPFEHSVSIIDLFFNVGSDASSYMLYKTTGLK